MSWETRCVNALKGATLISSGKFCGQVTDYELCQCPERGDPHFYYVTPQEKEAWLLQCVNALKGATLISTAELISNAIDDVPCVNALKGATLISTLASGNPHK